MYLITLTKAVVALFIVIDPLGLLPVFMVMTCNMQPKSRFRIFSKSAAVAFMLMLIIVFAGTKVLELFNITLVDFKIAGGILLLIIALKIINEAHYGVSGNGKPGVVPIAVPLIVGPGAITTTIVLIGSYGICLTLLALIITFLLMFIIFLFIEPLFKILGKTGSDVIAKLMGMLLAAIAIQFMREGLEVIVKKLL